MVKKVNLIKKTTLFPLKNRSLLLQVISFGAQNLPKKFPVNKEEVNVILLNDKKMSFYNESFLQHQGSTDVISFSNLDDDDELVGEIFVSLEMAMQYAKEYKTTFEEECILYIMHGLLHINGYDDHIDNDIKEMRFQENRLMNLIKKKFDLSELFKLC